MAALLIAVASECRAATVEVLLKDGTRIHADTIGPETDTRQLALCLQRTGIILTRHVPWKSVMEANVGGQRYQPEELWKIAFGDSGTTEFPVDQVRARFLSDPSDQPQAADSSPSSDAVGDPFADGVIQMAPPPAPADETPQRRAEDHHRLDRTFGTRGAQGIGVPWPGAPHPIPLDAVVVGVRCDPLSAYAEAVQHHFPFGVPLSETAFVLELMRARKAHQVLSACAYCEQTAPPGPPPEPAKALPAAPRPIRAISIDARPVSSNGNLDVNALIVELRGIDGFGRPAPVQGTLKAALWGQTQELVRSVGTRVVERPLQTKRLADWTCRIDASTPSIESPSAAPSAAVVTRDCCTVRVLLQLPRPLPDHNLNIASLGDLRVQLLVPGIGTLEAALPDVPLRRSSLFRERLLVETGSRFLSHERTSDSRTPLGLEFEKMSSLRPDGRVLTVKP